MRRWLLGGLFLGAASACPLWSGCAEQSDSGTLRTGEGQGATTATSGSGGDTAGTSATAGAAGKASSGGIAGVSNTAGTTSNAGNAPVAGAAQSGAGGAANTDGGAGEGGAGGAPDCRINVDCDDGNPCTTDTCQLAHCSYSSNTTACADDKDPCTADICAVGTCTHPSNGTCACTKDAQCDDGNVCTDNHCNALHQCEYPNNTAACADDGMSCTTDVCAAGACTHKNNGTCGVGTPFTVDNFNSSADWLVNKTTPDQRAIVVTGINASNLEGNADLWIAEADTGTIEFALASLEGLGKLRIVIRSVQANTGGMVFVGLWNGAAWSDKALGTYAQIPTGTYATIEVPTTDFAQQLKDVTKLRLRFAVTGGEKTWQIDEISAAK